MILIWLFKIQQARVDEIKKKILILLHKWIIDYAADPILFKLKDTDSRIQHPILKIIQWQIVLIDIYLYPDVRRIKISERARWFESDKIGTSIVVGLAQFAYLCFMINQVNT